MNSKIPGKINLNEWTIERNSEQTDFRYPEKKSSQVKSHWQLNGLFEYHTCSVNLIGWWGVRVLFKQAREQEDLMDLKLACSINQNPAPEETYKANCQILVGKENPGELIIPLANFDLTQSNQAFLRAVKGFEISHSENIQIESVEFLQANQLLVEVPISSKPCVAEEAIYDVRLKNITDKEISASAQHKRYGWEVMTVSFQNEKQEDISNVILAPNEEKNITIKVTQYPRVPEGGSEKQLIQFISDSGIIREIELITVVPLSHPYTTLTRKQLQEVKAKINEADWAKEKFSLLLQEANEWDVPEIDVNNNYLFSTRESDEASNCALMYQLTGDIKFAEKTALFIQRLIDPKKGYMRLPKAGHQELVHEGEFFKHTALAYDMIQDSGLLSQKDCQNTELVFRKFMDLIDEECYKGGISNWTLAELSGVIMCAAVLTDLERMERFLYGIGGVTDHISKGILDDGWWYEASIGYNLLAMGLFLEITLVVERWGYNLKDLKVPANYATYVAQGGGNIESNSYRDGLSLEVWGPSRNNTRSISMLIDSMLPYFDYRSVIFGMNDSSEMKAPGISLKDPRYDLAYYLYNKEEYASLLRNVEAKDRDLYFGVPSLPNFKKETLEISAKSTYSDVAGAAILRSQTPNRNSEDQLQVSVKAGIHGGAHGHYDRLSLNSIMRYGQSFYNPENIWYSYHTFMYKFYVQNSITHNMPVVDLKLQDPTEPETFLFFSGRHLQVMGIRNRARWSNPPYGGWMVKDDKTFDDRSWNEGRFVPIPEKAPPYTRRTDFTEDIDSQRITVVTDDYVILFDSLKGDKSHCYDNLFHVSGLKSLSNQKANFVATEQKSVDEKNSSAFFYSEHADLTHVRQTEKFDESPLSSGQFITDCHWFTSDDVVKASFEMDMSQYNQGAWLTNVRTAYNEPGQLKMDIYGVYPSKKEIILGCDPEYVQTHQQLYYEVKADDETLTSGQFGAWILGREEVEVDVSQTKKLTLTTKVNFVEDGDGLKKEIPLDSIFWGESHFITKDNRKIFLNDLPYKVTNIKPVPEKNRDYFGGPVKIQGMELSNSIPGTPLAEGVVGTIEMELLDLDVEIFKSYIGGDYPLGDESKRRRTLSFRTQSQETDYVTLIEPYKENATINNVVANDKHSIIVLLTNGHRQEIKLLEDDLGCQVSIKEYRGEQLLKEEKTEVSL